MVSLKCCTVGDGNVGKTSMLIMFKSETFPTEYIPRILDNYTSTFRYENSLVLMEFCDTAGQEEFKFLRPLAYPNTDVFLLCFSIVDPTSYSNAENLWFPEIRRYCPEALVILVGTKQDLRCDKTCIEKLAEIGRSPIKFEEGWQLAKHNDAYMYLECSALNKNGLSELFNCVRLGTAGERELRPPVKKKRKMTLSRIRSFLNN